MHTQPREHRWLRWSKPVTWRRHGVYRNSNTSSNRNSRNIKNSVMVVGIENNGKIMISVIVSLWLPAERTGKFEPNPVE